MAVWCWRAAFSIVLSLNAAHAIANSAESSGAYLAEYCSGARGLGEVAQDETKISSQLCQSRSSNLKKGRERFHRFASVIHLNQSADSELMRTRMPTAATRRSQPTFRFKAGHVDD
jgi:hypothetical protein